MRVGYDPYYSIPNKRIDTLSALTVGFLAGGEGRRIGGRDKGLLIRNGELQISLLQQMLPDWVSEVIINSPRNPYIYRLFSNKLVSDYPSHTGPVGGLLAMLYACDTDWLAIVPSDQKQIPAPWITRWRDALTAGGPGYMATDNGKHTPLAIVPKAALSLGETFFDKGGRRLCDAYAAMGLTEENCPEAGLDIDYQTDL